MKIAEHLTPEQKIAFFDVFFGEYEKFSFAGMPKRDLDVLIFHSLIESEILSEEMKNRAIASMLSISENKIKSLLLDRSYKFLSDKRDENVRKVLQRIASNDIHLVRIEGMIVFVLENPVMRSDLEYVLKEELGYFIDSSFNREIVKMSEVAFVAFILQFYDGRNEEFRGKLIEAFESQKELVNMLNSEKDWLGKSKEFLQKGETVIGIFEFAKKAISIGMMLV